MIEFYEKDVEGVNEEGEKVVREKVLHFKVSHIVPEVVVVDIDEPASKQNIFHYPAEYQAFLDGK